MSVECYPGVKNVPCDDCAGRDEITKAACVNCAGTGRHVSALKESDGLFRLALPVAIIVLVIIILGLSL